jgi:hypothetical protein
MPTRIYDSSQLTKRRGEKAVAGSFLTRMYPPISPTTQNPVRQPQQGSAPRLGDFDSSIMNVVKSGHMTEFTRSTGCTIISSGCPCPELNASLTTSQPAIPGPVTGITFTVGSIIVSWTAPTTGDGPFIYIVTPYLNGVSLSSVTTGETSYRFTELQEWQPYTFTVCAMNGGGQGPTVASSTYFLAPPNGLSLIMSGSSAPTDPVPSLKYVINAGLDSMLQYIASTNPGPTKGSRFIYIWITSVVGAWNWVRSDSRISGSHDSWDWTTNKATSPLSDNDSIVWLCSVIDYITPYFIVSGYKSIYNCPAATVTRVKALGDWDRWLSSWEAWYNYRQNDGSIIASTAQPTTSANWNETIVVGSINNISGFPQPDEWTRLTVQGRKQGYLTYNWDSVLSSCLSEEDEATIQASVSPATGEARDLEVDEVKTIAANLTDQQKIIAEFWAGGPGTVSPPLMFIWFWKEYIKTIDISCPNIMFSILDLAIHMFEGARVTWRLKYAHMEARPIQEIRRRYTGQQVSSWNGVIDGGLWVPYQESNFVTPPFADFPSGHSHFSKAFALTMNKWFGESIVKNTTFYDKETLICPLFDVNQTATYGDFIVNSGSSDIQPGVVPSEAITLSFNQWNEMADQAGMSRLYGGIHCITAHTSSQQVAVEVDSYINSTWNIQTA